MDGGEHSPIWIGRAIDISHGRSTAATVFAVFGGFAVFWVLLRFISNVTPLVRDAIFTPVSQAAMARSAVETFGHSLSLSLNFHQGKQTGGLARVIDRGANSTDTLLRSVVFDLGPTAFELVMAAFVMTTHYNWVLSAATVATILVYVVLTFTISGWRIQFRRALNEAGSAAAGLTVDALMNFETIKTFGAEGRTVGRYQQARADYATAAVKANTSLQMLNALQTVVMSAGLGFVTLLAGFEVIHGKMTPGSITACILILQAVYAPLNMLGSNYRMIRQAFIDMEQMTNLLAVEPDITDAPDARPLPPASGKKPSSSSNTWASNTPPARSASPTSASVFRLGRPPRWSGRRRRRQDHHRAPGASPTRPAERAGDAGRRRCARRRARLAAQRRGAGAARTSPSSTTPSTPISPSPAPTPPKQTYGPQPRAAELSKFIDGSALQDGDARWRAWPA